MPTYNIQGWIWSGLGSATTLSPLTISDDDPQMSPYFTSDPTEILTILGNTYTDPQGGTYQLTFDDSGGTSHTEDFLLWSTGSNFVFAPLPGSAFDSGSIITSLGGWQEWTTGFDWVDVTCFALGTLIGSDLGPRPIETLKIGDLVKTSFGVSAIKWIGRRSFSASDLAGNPKLLPVRITKGALGNGLPERDLLVSRQHRMLVKSKIAVRMFGVKEVFVPAIKLTKLPGIYVDEDVEHITYLHLLFRLHEVIYAEGAPTESLLAGPQALKSIGPDAEEELLAIFPELQKMEWPVEPARYIPDLKRQKRLLERHHKNRMALLERDPQV